MISSGMMSSESGEWGTPTALFERLNDEFNFTVDICATADNRKLPHYVSKVTDALATPDAWEGRIFMNPPYGRDIGKWMERMTVMSRVRRLFGVCLIPVRSDTLWWHQSAMKANELRFIDGRVKYVGPPEIQCPYCRKAGKKNLIMRCAEKEENLYSCTIHHTISANAPPFPSCLAIYYGEECELPKLGKTLRIR